MHIETMFKDTSPTTLYSISISHKVYFYNLLSIKQSIICIVCLQCTFWNKSSHCHDKCYNIQQSNIVIIKYSTFYDNFSDINVFSAIIFWYYEDRVVIFTSSKPTVFFVIGGLCFGILGHNLQKDCENGGSCFEIIGTHLKNKVTV